MLPLISIKTQNIYELMQKKIPCLTISIPETFAGFSSFWVPKKFATYSVISIVIEYLDGKKMYI